MMSPDSSSQGDVGSSKDGADSSVGDVYGGIYTYIYGKRNYIYKIYIIIAGQKIVKSLKNERSVNGLLML
jgi:hypothetical protein